MSDRNENSRVQVSVRIRPVLKIDKANTDEAANRIAVTSGPNCTVLTSDEGTRGQKNFTFDSVFTGQDQENVFETIGSPMLKEAYKGFNACLFAYGQTGSGKTHSLLGDINDQEKRGIVPRFAQEMFDVAQHQVEENPDLTIKITLSMIEVYMEKIRDLLKPRQRGHEPESLELREDPNHRVYVKDVSVHPILSYERMLELVRQGNANRQTSETKMNETSSRSHAIVQITISQQFQSLEKKDLECTVSLVDLAGSERQTKTESTGVHFEEAKKINLSLLMLGRALNSFSDRKSGDAYISLRESKLTRLLSESFGGNSKTWMLATVSPTAYNLTESISTLEYATNAMAITNKVVVNSGFKSLEYKELKAVVSKLEEQLEALRAKREAKASEIAELEEEKNSLLGGGSPSMSGAADGRRTRLQEAVVALHFGNIALRRRVEAARHQLVWSLDNEASPKFFKGRCTLSLASVLKGKRESLSLSLYTDSNQVTPASLRVQIFPVEEPEEKVDADPYALVGTDLRFCVHVVGADGIPAAYASHSFCKLILRLDYKEDRSYNTPTAEGMTHPRWGLVKQFEIPNLTREMISYFYNQPLLAFEVFGFMT